jgi:hypothetical protein
LLGERSLSAAWLWGLHLLWDLPQNNSGLARNSHVGGTPTLVHTFRSRFPALKRNQTLAFWLLAA